MHGCIGYCLAHASQLKLNIMKKLSVFFAAATASLLLVLASCSKQDAIRPNPQTNGVLQNFADTPYLKTNNYVDTPYLKTVIVSTIIADTPYLKKALPIKVTR